MSSEQRSYDDGRTRVEFDLFVAVIELLFSKSLRIVTDAGVNILSNCVKGMMYGIQCKLFALV